ncbi:hypothetical protein K804_04275, partial [Salmonella enterica subsp. enterica serovar Newport str. SHSN014]
MLGGADNANGELPSYITGANKKKKKRQIKKKKKKKKA